MLDLHRAPAVVLRLDRRAPRRRGSDDGQPPVLRPGAEERPVYRVLRPRRADRGEHENVARRVQVHARHAPHELEVRLQRLERGLARRRDEDRVRTPVRGPRGERERMTESRHRLARERQVLLVDRECVELGQARQRPRRLPHQLGADAVAGEACDLLPRVAHAFTPSKTSASETGRPASASALKRRKAASRSPGSNRRPASWQARTNACRPECLPSGSVIARPSSAGSMNWYVATSLSRPSWWMPASWANAFAPTITLFRCTA